MRDPSGKPAPGVSVWLLGDYGNRTEGTTDPDGRYSLIWRKQGSAPQLVLFARDLERNLAASHEIDDTTTNLDLSLEPGLTLSVKAKDAGGMPVTSATATFAFMGWSLNPVSPRADDSSRIRADEEGLIEMNALPQGRLYTAAITSRGYSVTNVQVPAEKTKTTHFEFPAVVLRVADRELGGRVLGPDGKPYPRANVEMDGNGQVSTQSTTDARGRFAFTTLTEGTVHLIASIEGANGAYVSGFHPRAGRGHKCNHPIRR